MQEARYEDHLMDVPCQEHSWRKTWYTLDYKPAGSGKLMNVATLHALIGQGENQALEFKIGEVRPEALAREMTGFANSLGGSKATKEELSRLFQAAGLVHFDISPVMDTEFKDLDLEKIHAYFQATYQLDFAALDSEEQQRILSNIDVLTPSGDSGLLLTTVGGLLLFGKQPQRRLPQASIMFAVVRGVGIADEILDKKEVTGTLDELIEKTQALVRLFLPEPLLIENMRRAETAAIPSEVIREALVNAVAHRDYSLWNRKTQVVVFSDRVEIVSPGRLPNTLTLEKIRFGNSAPRNHLIVKVLDNLRYIDGLGRGIPSIIRLMGDRARWEEEGELLRLTLVLDRPIKP